MSRAIQKGAALLIALAAVAGGSALASAQEATQQAPGGPARRAQLERPHRISHEDRMKAAAVLKRMKADADARRAEQEKRNQSDSQTAPSAGPLAPSHPNAK